MVISDVSRHQPSPRGMIPAIFILRSIALFRSYSNNVPRQLRGHSAMEYEATEFPDAIRSMRQM